MYNCITAISKKHLGPVEKEWISSFIDGLTREKTERVDQMNSTWQVWTENYVPRSYPLAELIYRVQL